MPTLSQRILTAPRKILSLGLVTIPEVRYGTSNLFFTQGKPCEFLRQWVSTGAIFSKETFFFFCHN